MSTREQLAAFLAEDLGGGDVTSDALVPEGVRAAGRVHAGQPAVLAGLEEAVGLAALRELTARPLVEDGDRVAADAEILDIEGNARGVLGVERTLLNLISHMSGIATLTRHVVDAVERAHTGAHAPRPPRVAATRKTLPGLRHLQKKAVVLGGGLPHRLDLSAAVLVKDNHLALSPDLGAVIDRLRTRLGDSQLEIEVESIDDALFVARRGVDAVLLDNFTPDGVIEVVEALKTAGLRDAVSLEASGGIIAESVSRYADTGVDVISMGTLTLSAPHVDFSMHFDV